MDLFNLSCLSYPFFHQFSIEGREPYHVYLYHFFFLVFFFVFFFGGGGGLLVFLGFFLPLGCIQAFIDTFLPNLVWR